MVASLMLACFRAFAFLCLVRNVRGEAGVRGEAAVHGEEWAVVAFVCNLMAHLFDVVIQLLDNLKLLALLFLLLLILKHC